MPSFNLGTLTATDGYVWRFRRYEPAQTPRSHLVCIHGIQSHAGWYEKSCSAYAAAGHRVSFLDRRGSGMNLEARGDAPGFRRLLDDIAEFLKIVRQENMPVFLLPGRLFPIPLNEPELFTAEAVHQKFIAEDPLRLTLATARLLVESVRLDFYLRWNARSVTAPVLLLLAGRDRIIHNEPTRRLLERFGTRDREIIEYPEAHHTLEFEPDPERHIADVLRWIEAHAPRPSEPEA
jgi:alpha-beta hydrolase superfamily lysophospholipase